MPDRSGVEPADAGEGGDAARGRDRARPRGRRRSRGQDRCDARADRRTPFARARARRSPSGSTASGRRGGGTISPPWPRPVPTSWSSRRSSPRTTWPWWPGSLPAGTGLEAQIETARGLVEVERIAAAGHGLEALVFGPGDFAASIGVPVLTIGEGSWDYALARIVVAARAFGLQAVDGPYAAIGDLRRAPRLRAPRARARTRRQVGRPSRPDRAGQRGVHAVAGGARARAADPRRRRRGDARGRRHGGQGVAPPRRGARRPGAVG